MTDTAQPVAAETLSVVDNPFKTAREGSGSFGAKPRDEQGRFAAPAPPEEEPAEAEEEEIEAEAGVPAEAESHEAEHETDEAADEAQPTAVDLPTSWPAEHAEMWTALPPEAQAIIAEREGQRDAAVNAKFQEAANLRKAHEAEISEAQANRDRYAEAADLVLSLVAPQRPPLSMLDAKSDDYDPDAYHLANARYEQSVAFLEEHAAQRQHLAAQEQQARYDAINAASRDRFIKDVPEITDGAKAPAIIRELMDYAIGHGAPADMFDAPTTALEFHLLWKAREYDRLQSAKAKVAQAPRPEPRKAQPAVRPGVTTSRSAVKAAQREKDFERVRKEGSVESLTRIWKHYR